MRKAFNAELWSRAETLAIYARHADLTRRPLTSYRKKHV